MFRMGNARAGQVRSYGRWRALYERTREIDEKIGAFIVYVCEERGWRRLAGALGEGMEETRGVFGRNWEILGGLGGGREFVGWMWDLCVDCWVGAYSCCPREQQYIL